jgi:hypothetical protein
VFWLEGQHNIPQYVKPNPLASALETLVWSDTLTQLKREMKNPQRFAVGIKGAKKRARQVRAKGGAINAHRPSFYLTHDPAPPYLGGGIYFMLTKKRTQKKKKRNLSPNETHPAGLKGAKKETAKSVI